MIAWFLCSNMCSSQRTLRGEFGNFSKLINATPADCFLKGLTFFFFLSFCISLFLAVLDEKGFLCPLWVFTGSILV